MRNRTKTLYVVPTHSKPGSAELILQEKYSSLLGGRERPCLYAIITNHHGKSNSITVPLILDTGADHCLLPFSYCGILCHELAAGGKPVKLTGVGGDISAYKHTNKITFAGETLVCEFYFCKKWDPGCGLLGHSGFFDNYDVFFHSRMLYHEIFK